MAPEDYVGGALQAGEGRYVQKEAGIVRSVAADVFGKCEMTHVRSLQGRIFQQVSETRPHRM